MVHHVNLLKVRSRDRPQIGQECFTAQYGFPAVDVHRNRHHSVKRYAAAGADGNARYASDELIHIGLASRDHGGRQIGNPVLPHNHSAPFAGDRDFFNPC